MNTKEQRLRENHERAILERVKADGLISYFWITESRRRAQAMDRLIKRGIIQRIGKLRFPCHRYQVARGKQ